MNHQTTLGEKIRALRMQRGYTQVQLAQILQVSPTYISKIERNYPNLLPSQRLLRQLAGALKTDERELSSLSGRFDTHALRQRAMREPAMRDLLSSLPTASPKQVQLILEILLHSNDAPDPGNQETPLHHPF